MHLDQGKLKTFLVDSGLISKKDADLAASEAEERGAKIGDILIAKSLISENDLRHVSSYVLGVPFVSLAGQKIPIEVLSLIPEPVARAGNIVAYAASDDAVEVAMLDTENIVAVDTIRKQVGKKVLVRLTDDASIKHVLTQYQKSLKEEFGDLISKDAKLMKVVKDDGGEGPSANDLKKLAEDLPVVRVVETLLKHAIVQRASDIHIEPTEREVLVRYRIDGILHDAMTLPKDSGPSIVARIKVLASLKLDEKRLPQDGRFKIETDGEKVSFRVSLLPTYYGEKVVMRLLREGGGHFTLETLGFHGDGLERIQDAMKQTTGIILVTGPTGSGKTTTLYTILELLNTPDVNISTIEDPIEYQMPRVNQTQVHPAIGLTFSAGLRALMRQDPNIIMVGEIRDKETAQLAINAALTGHLVLSTLHTNSAAGAVPRMVDMGVEKFLLASTLRVVIGQRLVRVLCKGGEPYKLKEKDREGLAGKDRFDLALSALRDEKIVPAKTVLDDLDFHRPKASSECEEGYSGRRGIHEILSLTPTIKELILRDASADQIEEQARKEGMLTMLEDGIYKAAKGVTSLEEVLRVVSE